MVFWFELFLEARAEIKKIFYWVFGSNENKKICFRNYLTFRTNWGLGKYMYLFVTQFELKLLWPKIKQSVKVESHIFLWLNCDESYKRIQEKLFSNVFWMLPKEAVHKLRLQDKVGRWSKNIHFLSTFIP